MIYAGLPSFFGLGMVSAAPLWGITICSFISDAWDPLSKSARIRLDVVSFSSAISRQTARFCSSQHFVALLIAQESKLQSGSFEYVKSNSRVKVVGL